MSKIPAAVGPYSSHRIVNGFLYASGQLPLNPETNAIEAQTIEEQTKQSLTNVKAILESEGYSMSDVIKTTVYLDKIEDFGKMNEVYGQFFAEPYPARSAVEVANLPKAALVEIEVVAFK